MSDASIERHIKVALISILAALGFGLALVAVAARLDLHSTFNKLIFFFLAVHHEPAILLILVLGTAASYRLLLSKKGIEFDVEALGEISRRLSPNGWVALISLITLTFCWLGTHFIYHCHPFSMDEFGATFEAQILLAGKFHAAIPAAYREWTHALTPIFVNFNASEQAWMSGYLPAYAAMRALFLFLGAPTLLNPMLGAVSLLALSGIIAKLWPERPTDRVLGVILLASSAQFVITSLSYYSMPAHLCLNLIWLWLYVQDSKWSTALLPWVGVVAMGLHQIVVHALFALPFLFRIVLERRWAKAAYVATVYLGGCALWLSWYRFVAGDTFVGDVATQAFGMQNLGGLLTQGMNLTLLISWQSVALLVLFILGVGQWRTLPAVAKDMLFSILVTMLFYATYLDTQGHGWGYRYIYGILGNIVLLAIPGWRLMCQQLGSTQSLRFVALSTTIALFIQLPIRCVQTEAVIRPFASAQQYLRSRPEAALIIHPESVWYGSDLIRNDPFLEESPKILWMTRLTREQAKQLSTLGPVRAVDPSELAKFGMFPRQARR